MLNYILKTERLILKDLELNDAQSLFQLMSLEQTHHWSIFKKHETLDDTIHFINNSDGFYYKVGVFIKNTNEFIGMCSFKIKDIDGYPNGCTSIGYYLLPQFQGYGYATETSKVLIKFSFEYLHAKKVIATCDPLNEKSYNVMERCHMKRDGIIRYDKYTECGKWRNSLQYSILDHEYEKDIILEAHKHIIT